LTEEVGDRVSESILYTLLWSLLRRRAKVVGRNRNHLYDTESRGKTAEVPADKVMAVLAP